MARNAERSSVSNNQKNVERKPRRRSKVRDPGTKDGVSKSLFIWQWVLSMPLLPALKVVLMLCKTVVWRFASNTEEVSEAHAVHRNSKNQGGCARREGQISPHQFPDFLGTRCALGFEVCTRELREPESPQRNVCVSVNYVCFCSCESSVSLIGLTTSRPAQRNRALVSDMWLTQLSVPSVWLSKISNIYTE